MGDNPEDDNTYYLEEVEMEDDAELDTMEFQEVPEEDDDDDDDEEDFGAVLHDLKNNKAGVVAAPSEFKDDATRTAPQVHHKPGINAKPTVMDDFLRNFLIKLNMTRTLDAFNTEWYEMKEQGKLNAEDIGAVTDVYQRNENLDNQVKQLREEVLKTQDIADRARGTWDKFRKERDFHRMHHRRVVQEKNILIRDMKRLQKHYATFEPALKAMRAKYESAMKDKMVMKLERDKMATKFAAVEHMMSQVGTAKGQGVDEGTTKVKKVKKEKTIKPSNAAREFNAMRRPGEAELPADDRRNPYLDAEYEQMVASRMGLGKTFQGHQMAVSGLALHPTKPIVATVSDDRTWKMWSINKGELIMSGDGHKDWIGACDFHPQGALMATASGDGTVKVWDFVQAKCSMTFTDHTQAVWDCAFHDTGDFLVSASMDHTAKVWDINSGRCRQTIRGHVDSVNRVSFQPFSNNICTASGDKTVSLWDIRSGLCIQTFYGHENAVLAAAFSYQGDTIASSDSDGVIKLWDVRMVAEKMAMVTPKRVAVNDVKFDMSGKTLVSACDDGAIKIFNLTGEGELAGQLDGHEGAVQAVVVDPEGKFIIGGGSDQTFRIFGG